MKTITFASTNRDFASTLNKRVNDYFKTKNLSRHANTEMIVKSFVMFALYLIPYVLIVTGVVTGTGWLIASTIIMGFGLAGIGLSVMHDANHGAYSNRAW